MNRKQNRLQEKDREKHLNTPLKDPHANYTRAIQKAEDRYGKVQVVFTRPERQKLLDEGISAGASAQSSLHAMSEPEFKPLFTYSPKKPLYIWLLESAVELKTTFSLEGAKYQLKTRCHASFDNETKRLSFLDDDGEEQFVTEDQLEDALTKVNKHVKARFPHVE